MTFKELREASGMNQREFGEYFGIPLRTIQNWHGGQRDCPDYLLKLMQYKLEKEGIIKMEENNMKIWYAVMMDLEDTDWRTGSREREKALEMARQYRSNGYAEAYVAVIEESEPAAICIEEIHDIDE